MMDLYFLLEDGDLLEQTELDLDIIEEASMIINKGRLNDEKYVRELISDIKKPGSKIKVTVGDVIFMISFMMVPLTLNPLTIALCVLVNTLIYALVVGGFTEDTQAAKSKQKILNNIDRLIVKLERDKNKATDKEVASRLDGEIKKLKHNRELVEKK